MTLTVWGRRTSSNVQALMWCIEELGLDVVRHDVGHRYGGNDTPEFLAMNPNGTVPVLKDGDGEPLWETAAIIRYLAGRYGGETFWPRDDLEKAYVDKWAEWSKINVAIPFTMSIFWRVVRTAPSRQDPAIIAQAVGEFDAVLDIAERRLQDTAFLAGAHFTPADIQFGHVLYRYFDIEIIRRERPTLDQYYRSLENRQPFRDHVMVPYEELRVFD